MPLLWKWFRDSRKSLILCVVLFLLGWPLIAVGVLDKLIDSILAGIFAIFASLFVIRREWFYFRWRQKQMEHQERQDGSLTNGSPSDSSSIRDLSHPGNGPNFAFDLDSGPPKALGLIYIVFLIYLIYILSLAKPYIVEIVVVLDVAALVAVLGVVFAAYISDRCSLKKLRSVQRRS
jgi:hypothetical protein